MDSHSAQGAAGPEPRHGCWQVLASGCGVGWLEPKECRPGTNRSCVGCSCWAEAPCTAVGAAGRQAGLPPRNARPPPPAGRRCSGDLWLAAASPPATAHARLRRPGRCMLRRMAQSLLSTASVAATRAVSAAALASRFICVVTCIMRSAPGWEPGCRSGTCSRGCYLLHHRLAPQRVPLLLPPLLPCGR